MSARTASRCPRSGRKLGRVVAGHALAEANLEARAAQTSDARSVSTAVLEHAAAQADRVEVECRRAQMPRDWSTIVRAKLAWNVAARTATGAVCRQIAATSGAQSLRSRPSGSS